MTTGVGELRDSTVARLEKNAALKGSILHWEQIVLKNPEHEPGGDECPLCVKYTRPRDEPCNGCPIANRTNDTGCTGTPYDEAHDEWFHQAHSGDETTVFWRQKMLDYLRETLAMILIAGGQCATV